MTRTRSERPQWRETTYSASGFVLLVTSVGQTWLFHPANGFQHIPERISRARAASLLRDWRKGGAR